MSTKIQDVIQPEVFTPYVIQRTMELSALIQSGIARNMEEFDRLASGPNTLVNMPYWEDLTGDPETMNDQDDTVPGKIEANKDVARKLAFTKSYGANALAALLSGDDPMRAIADLFAAYWQRQYQRILLCVLDGIFDASNMTDKVHDITGQQDNLINGKTFLDAVQRMGDAKDLLTGVMMHSAVENYLAKNDLIEFKEESQGKVRVPYFLNKRVIVDDNMPFNQNTGTGVAYLFGEGAIAWGNGSHPRVLQTEVVRNGMQLAGEDVLVNRRILMMHPRGVKWTETDVTAPGQFPTMQDLQEGSNWSRVYESKAVRIVKFVFDIE